MLTLNAIEENLNPFPIYQEMRARNPVYYNPERYSYNVFRYEDVQRVLSEYETFSSQYGRGEQMPEGQPFAASMISTDPPRHRKLRSLVTQAFTPRAVESLAPRIQTIVDEQLQQVLQRQAGKTTGQMDVIHDLGYPLPVTVIAELLGIPVEDRERFKKWSDQVVSMADVSGEMKFDHFNDAVMEMGMYFLNMIEQRRNQPGSDLISGLLQANIDGETLDQIELLGFCVLLLVAGNETTTNLIGNAMMTFTEQPELWERLRAERDLLPIAIEEVLRYRSPVQSMFRTTKVDTEVNGVEIPAGSHIVAWIGSANHDEEQFPEAESFIIDRSPNRHLAFGQGIHYCLGAPLARLEARIALEGMIDCFASVRPQPGARLERLPSMIVFGVKSLPVLFTQT